MRFYLNKRSQDFGAFGVLLSHLGYNQNDFLFLISSYQMSSCALDPQGGQPIVESGGHVPQSPPPVDPKLSWYNITILNIFFRLIKDRSNNGQDNALPLMILVIQRDAKNYISKQEYLLTNMTDKIVFWILLFIAIEFLVLQHWGNSEGCRARELLLETSFCLRILLLWKWTAYELLNQLRSNGKLASYRT